MTTAEGLALPGTPGERLSSVWEAMTASERHAFLPHLTGSTSTEWLAEILRAHGFVISPTSIKVYRRSLRQNGIA